MKVVLVTFFRLIWKWAREEMSDLPSNVILQSWLPQQDLLANHHLKVFVTHGGLLSLQETLYHSTPIVGIPLGNDQKRSGYAVMLDWPSLNTETFVAAIIKATSDPDIAANMKIANTSSGPGSLGLPQPGLVPVPPPRRHPPTYPKSQPEGFVASFSPLP